MPVCFVIEGSSKQREKTGARGKRFWREESGGRIERIEAVQSHLEAENRTNLLITIYGETWAYSANAIFVLICSCSFCKLFLVLYVEATGTSWMVKEIVCQHEVGTTVLEIFS